MANLINGRYELHEKLGIGGMGAVYRATDKLTDSIVALKRVTAPHHQSNKLQELQLSLANEFKALASLRHPNIIPVLDYGFDAGLPYFTMEYIRDARTITEVGRHAPHQQKIDLLVQMLQALAYLHRQGIIHRDLKPQNALVNVEGHLMLLDFGLAEENPTASLDGTISGTLAYIAPEVLQGVAPTESSDLYAFGLIAYELFAGYYPFDEGDIPQFVTEIMNTVPDMSDLDITRELGTIIERLLAKRPHKRYQQAQEVMKALADIGLMNHSVEERDNWNSYLQAAKFVGRQDELSTLEDALEQAMAGKGSAWLIGGESGVGKSRLLSELQIRAMVRGMTVLTGEGVMSGGLPYQLWRLPVRRLALVTEIDDLDAGILKEIAPDLDRLLGYEVALAPPVNKDQAQRRLIAAIVTLFRTYGKPIVLLLEDLQWMIESLEVLKQLSRAVADMPILILATYRSDERPNLPEELDPMQLMMLERLHLNEIADLSESMIGESGRAPQVVELLAKETEGNVFFLIETIRALAEIAGLMDNIGRMTLPPTVFAGGVQMVIERRLRKVPQDFIPLLQLVAINGRLLDLALVEALDETIDIQTWLDACINSAVLSVNDGEYRFAHDKIREGILANIDADSFIILSRRIAEAIEKVYPNEDNLALVLAQHWQNAQDADRECHYSYIVAQKVRHHNLHQARDYALRVLELLPDDRDPRLPKVELILGEIYLNISNRDKAQFYFESGLKNAEHQRQRDYQARCLEGLGHVALRHDDGEQAMKYYQMALRRADPKDHETVALIMNSISTVHKNWGDYDKARQLAEESLALARANEYQIGIARDLNTLGVLDSYQGRYDDARDKFVQVLETRRDLRMRHGVAGVLNNLGIIASRMGKHQEAIAYHEESRQIKLDLGDRFSLGNTLQNLSLTYMHIGNYELARHYSEEALEIAREMVHRSAEADIRNNLGLILSRLHQDDLQTAREHIEAAIVLAGEVEDRLCVAYALSNLGDILITQNELDVARGILDLALREAYDLQAMSPLLRTLMWIGRMIEMNGDVDRAITLWSYVNLHESSDAFTQQDSEQLLQSAIVGLSAERIAKAVDEAKTLEMDTLVESLRRKPKHQI